MQHPRPPVQQVQAISHTIKAKGQCGIRTNEIYIEIKTQREVDMIQCFASGDTCVYKCEQIYLCLLDFIQFTLTNIPFLPHHPVNVGTTATQHGPIALSHGQHLRTEACYVHINP